MGTSFAAGPSRTSRRCHVWLVAQRVTDTNAELLAAFERLELTASLYRPAAAGEQPRRGTVAVGRLDVRPSLDGVEDGMWELRRLERAGVLVLNGAAALEASHDKLATALRLAAAGVPHPRTHHVRPDARFPDVEPPVVVKPRFGSWGRDVVLCETRTELDRCFAQLVHRPWFAIHGALVQEFLGPVGFDLRLVVSGGRVIGAIRRVARPGEWRTNVALGASRERVTPDAGARALAVAAAAAVDGDLVGIDILPLARGGYVVLEVNGAVDFSREYGFGRGSVYVGAALALLEAVGHAIPAMSVVRQVGDHRGAGAAVRLVGGRSRGETRLST